MKIGLLTFHRAHNYGAILQAYALQEFLITKNYDVEFIDYYNKSLLNVYNWFSLKRLKSKSINSFINEIKKIPKRKKRYDAFKNFIKSNLSLSNKRYDLNSYNLIIIGSDQVWNKQLTNGFDNMYWGNFPHTSDCKIISYAASMQDNINEEDFQTIKKLLNNFSGISVREKSIKAQLTKLTSKDISTVLDPTLILDKKIWDEFSGERLIKEKYILVYQVRYNSQIVTIAENISKLLNLKIFYLSARVDCINSKGIDAIGPREYINLFKFADYVICTSFHGTVFSVIFNIPFCSVLLNDGKDARVLDLLKDLDLENRGTDVFHNGLFDEINWKTVNEKLSELRNQSIKYLSQYI